jgi:hypothetical protein
MLIAGIKKSKSWEDFFSEFYRSDFNNDCGWFRTKLDGASRQTSHVPH